MDLIFCFDIDGTLLSTNGAGTRSFQKATLSLFGKTPNWSLISMAGRVDIGIFKDILKLIEEEYSDFLWNEFKSLYIRYLKEEIKPDNLIVFEGVYHILDYLNKEDKILVTGNIKEGAQIKLDFKNLSHYFNWERSVFSDDASYHRDELAKVLISRNPKKMPVVIGDTPLDINLAKIVGGISVAVTTGVYSAEQLMEYKPDFIFNSLSDLKVELIYDKISLIV